MEWVIVIFPSFVCLFVWGLCFFCIYPYFRKVVQEYQEKGENIKKKFLEGLNFQGNRISQHHTPPARYIGYRKRTIIHRDKNTGKQLWSVTKDFCLKYELEFTPGGAIQGTCEYSDDTKKNLQGYYTVSDDNINCTWIEGIDFNEEAPQGDPKVFLTAKNLQKMKKGDNVIFGNVKGELQLEGGIKFCENFSGKYETPITTVIELVLSRVAFFVQNEDKLVLFPKFSEDDLKLQPFTIERNRMHIIDVALFEFNADFIQNTNKASQKYSYPLNYTFDMVEDIEALASKYTIQFDINGQLNGTCYNEREGKQYIVGFYTSSTTEIYCTWIQSNKQIDTNLFLHNFDAGQIQQIVEESTIFEIVSLKGKIDSLIKSLFVGKMFFGTRLCSRGDPNVPLKLNVLREYKH